jgi:molybdenum cofactor cytidylyltransferase
MSDHPSGAAAGVSGTPPVEEGSLGAPMRLGVVILAAGSSRRFGETKQLALLGGRPLLQHVVDAVAEVSPAVTIAVLGHDADRVEGSIDWHGAILVQNSSHAEGLASSVRAGFRAIAAMEPPIDGAFVCLGDQPLLRPSVLRAIAEAASGTDRPIVVPAYSGEAAGATNPALVLRPAWQLVDELHGDRGMGPVIASHPELVQRVPVEGGNPDVDTLEDLARL